MAELDLILQRNVAQGDDTANKLLGAAFAVTDGNGMDCPTLVYMVTYRQKEYYTRVLLAVRTFR